MFPFFPCLSEEGRENIPVVRIGQWKVFGVEKYGSGTRNTLLYPQNFPEYTFGVVKGVV